MRVATTLSSLAFISAITLAACQPAENKSEVSETSVARSGQVTSTGQAQIGGAYTLVNEKGETVTNETFLGAPQMIYFGFAYCPDVCPMALQKMAAGLEIMGEDGADIQPIFITVDPERDTVESLAPYVTANSFPDGLTALTGTREQVDQAMDAYKVTAIKVVDPDYPEDYTMDHSSIIYLLDDKGQFLGLFTHQDSPERIATNTKAYLRR